MSEPSPYKEVKIKARVTASKVDIIKQENKRINKAWGFRKKGR